MDLGYLCGFCQRKLESAELETYLTFNQNSPRLLQFIHLSDLWRSWSLLNSEHIPLVMLSGSMAMAVALKISPV